MKKIYLDYAATTPVDPRVVTAMLPYFGEHFGNASSIHQFGLDAKVALDQAHEALAAALRATPMEIVFTSGGTEANNLALFGVAENFMKPGHLISSAIEHPSVLEVCKRLQNKGWRLSLLPVDATGIVHPETLERAIADDSALISIMFANNELGTINPIAELAAIARARNIPFHTDAVQAFGKLDIDLRQLPVALMSISSHKIYGPKGAGALFIRQGTSVSPLLLGGSQERRRRGGTENIPAIVGFAKAVEIASAERESERKRVAALAEQFGRLMNERVPDAHRNGHPTASLPWVQNYAFPGSDSTALIMGMDLRGIAISSGSACSSGSVEISHVLRALKLPKELQSSSVRFSFGRLTTEQDIVETVEAIATLTRSRRRPAPGKTPVSR